MLGGEPLAILKETLKKKDVENVKKVLEELKNWKKMNTTLVREMMSHKMLLISLN